MDLFHSHPTSILFNPLQPTSTHCSKKISFSSNFNPLELVSTNVGRTFFPKNFFGNFFSTKFFFANIFSKNISFANFVKNKFFWQIFLQIFSKIFFHELNFISQYF